ncbi:MAG: Ig-like domain-containing protein [Eubacterium sp.]|nr:Ig-like domain-containing protein [Eubacterium sp.]
METLKQSVKRNKRQLSLLLCLALVFSLFGGIRVKEVKAETANEDTWIEANKTTVSGSAATVKAYKYDKAPQELEDEATYSLLEAKYPFLESEVFDKVYPAKESGETVKIVKAGKDENYSSQLVDKYPNAEIIYCVARTIGNQETTNGAITWVNGCWCYFDARKDGLFDRKVYLYSPSDIEVSKEAFRVEQKKVFYVYENYEKSYVADSVRIVLTLADKKYVINSGFEPTDPHISDKDDAITLKWGDIELTAEMQTTFVPCVKGFVAGLRDGEYAKVMFSSIDGNPDENAETETEPDGSYQISHIKPGTHMMKVEVYNGGEEPIRSMTKLITLVLEDDGTNNYLYKDKNNTVLNRSLCADVSGEGGQCGQHVGFSSDSAIDAKVDAGSMNAQFTGPDAADNKKGITAEDKALIQNGGNIKLDLRVGNFDPTTSNPQEQQDQANAIQTAILADGFQNDNDMYMEINLKKTRTPLGGPASDPLEMLEANAPIKLEIPTNFPPEAKQFRIYRYHDGNVERVNKTVNNYGESVTVENGLCKLSLKRFCLYAIAYSTTPPSAPPAAPPAAPPIIWYPTASPTPTVEPTAEPTAEPTLEPTVEPTVEPTAVPTVEPTAVPTVVPTVEPTAVPTKEPQAQPTASSKKQKVKTMLLEVEKVSGDTMTLSWDKVSGADGYDLYHSKCDTPKKKNKLKFYKTFKSAKTTSFTFKELKKDQWYKDRVYAWKMVNGKKVVIGKSIIVHEYVKKQNVDTKWGNPTEVEVSEKKISLAKGKTEKLSAKVVTTKGKSLGDHGRKIRYVVSDDTIVSVTKKGKVKAKKKGKCTVYVVAQNGLKKKVKVTVK